MNLTITKITKLNCNISKKTNFKILQKENCI